MPEKLSPKQKMFCLEYVVDFNGAGAAVRAGYSEKTAKEQATRLLTNVHIKKRVEELTATKVSKSAVTAEMVLAELKKIAFMDVRKLYGKDEVLLPITQVDDDTAGAIAGLEIEEIYQEGACIGNTKKIKLADKAKALDMFMKHLGMFDKDNAQKNSVIKVVVK